MSKATDPKQSRTGTLRIGDQWNAINIIARSQTHPLKAVCELTENAIDAKATHIQIVRRRSKGHLYLEVNDNGEGIPTKEGNEPDFSRIATHVCDSMKRHLNAQQRAGVHGEFGIGLLSFWSLGEELRMGCGTPDGRVFEMRLKRGNRNYSIRPLRTRLPFAGTHVLVGPLLESTKSVVTGEKLTRYLSTELRDRIRSSGVRIIVLDRVARKEFVVQPREFEGERVVVGPALTTPYGEILVELHFSEPGSRNSHEVGVAVCKDGTRVLKDITDLVQFQRAPWTEGRFEGVLDFAALELAPGTRGGIVPDEKLTAFVEAVKTLEGPLSLALEEREQAETDKASRDILKQVQRAFRNALRDLPSNEYVFFDVPELKEELARRFDGNGYGKVGLPMPESAGPSQDTMQRPDERPLLPLEPGPLASVRITPRFARRAPEEECVLSAVARDAHGMSITEGVDFTWRVLEGKGTLVVDGHKSSVFCREVSQVRVQVQATQNDDLALDEVTVKFLDNPESAGDETAKGLPSYRLEPEHGKPWRSRYDAKNNEIIINSAHRDFLSSRTTAAKHRRFIGKLYAKEVVLINFPHESPSEILERLIQLTLRTEDVL